MADRITRIRYGSGGGDVIDFTDPASGYTIVTDGYRPAVSRRKRGVLGGERLVRVDETMQLMVSGADAEEANDRLDLLNAVIDQAQQWRDGAAVHVVTLEYGVEGSVLANPLQAAITGQPSSGEVMQLPFSYDSAVSSTVIGSLDDPIVFRFERRGALLGDEESQVSSSAGENPIINTASFTGALVTPSPVKLNIEFTSGNGSAAEAGAALAFIADDADKLYLSTALIGSTSGSSTVTNNHADANASANQVLQIVPNDTTEILVQSNIDGTFPANDGSHAYMFFLVVQNLSSSVYWDITQIAYYRPGSNTSNIKTLTNVRVTADNNNPQIVAIGPLVFDHPISLDASSGTQPYFYIQPSAGSGAGHELEIDSIAIVELGAGMTALTLRDINFSNADNQVIIDHALLSRLKPSVIAGITASAVSDHSISYDGIPYIYNNTAEIAVLVLGIQDDNWILGHAPSGTFFPVSVGIKATRRPAYLVPR